MTNFELRTILKDISAENFHARSAAIEAEPKRSREIITKMMDAQDRLKKYIASDLYRMKVKAYANNYKYSDVHAYEVVRIVSAKCVEVRRLDTEQIERPQEFHKGGFVGNFSDNERQSYKYISNEENPVYKIRWSKANRQWQGKAGKFVMADQPTEFYDYNF